jgi:putative N6-adenine-specific DNA methylase
MEALKFIGLKPSKKIPLKNGALDCKFQKYEMYSGSKKSMKN